MSQGNLRRFLNDPSCKLALSTGDINYLNKHHSISGNPTVVNSPFGKSIHSGGPSDVKDFNLTADFSISCWFKFDSIQEGGNYLLNFQGDGDRIILGFHHNVYPGELQYWDDSCWNNTGVNVIDHLWHHAVVTKTGTSVLLYLDNSIELSITSTANLDSILTLVNGADSSIDQILIYSRALSPQEISDIYHGTTFNYLDNLVGWWKLDDENIVRDLSNNGNDGTVHEN